MSPNSPDVYGVVETLHVHGALPTQGPRALRPPMYHWVGESSRAWFAVFATWLLDTQVGFNWQSLVPLPPFLSGTCPCCCPGQVSYVLPLSFFCHFPPLKHRSGMHFMLLKDWRGSASGLESLCGLWLQPVTFQPPPHTLPAHTPQWLAVFLDLTSGQICFLRVSAYFSRCHVFGRQWGLASHAWGGEGGSRRGTSKRGVDAKERTSQGLSSFPPWYNYSLEQKIGIKILTNTNALRIFKIKPGKFCCICQNPGQNR